MLYYWRNSVLPKHQEFPRLIARAIGHAEVYYDPSKNEVKFVDEPAGYQETLTFQEFVEKALEIEDSISAFTYTMILLRLYDLIMVANPYAET